MKRSRAHPFVGVVGLFVGVMFVGGGLLSMPWASTSGVVTPWIDALFTAASALFVTGLALYDTGTYWSLPGQLVILSLIQIGALGVVMIGGYLSVVMGRRIYFRDRKMLGDSLGVDSTAGVVKLLRRVVLYVLAVQFFGALLLTWRFWQYFPGWEAVYKGIFHTVSAFGNAGFDVMGAGNSLSPLAGDWGTLAVVAGLIMIGGLGFPVWDDMVNRMWGGHLTFHTKLVLAVNIILWTLGTLGFVSMEWGRRAEMVGGGQVVAESMFHSVSARTAGFALFDLTELRHESIVLLVILMFIGGAPASTAGGVKVTTMVVAVLVTWRMVSGQAMEVFKRRITFSMVSRAMSVIMLYLVFVVVGIVAVNLLHEVHFVDALFEMVSAVGTVGLSLGMTGDLTTGGKVITIFLMFMGRVGFVGLIYGLLFRQQKARFEKRHPAAKLLLT